MVKFREDGQGYIDFEYLQEYGVEGLEKELTYAKEDHDLALEAQNTFFKTMLEMDASFEVRENAGRLYSEWQEKSIKALAKIHYISKILIDRLYEDEVK